MDPFTQHHLTNRRTPLSDDDPLGVEAWAEDSGIPMELALVLATSVLTAVAGPAFYLNVPIAGSGGATFNLIARQGDYLLGMALGQLTETLVNVQTALRRRSRNVTIDNLFSARHEGYRLRNDEDLQFMANSRDPTRAKFKPNDRLDEDLHFNEEGVRMEALLHPDFLLIGSLAKNIESRLSQCHGGLGYFVGNPGSLPRDTARRDKQVDELLRFLQGVAAKSGHPKFVTPVETRELVLSATFMFPEPDLKWLIENRRDFLGHGLLVSSGTGQVVTSGSEAETRQATAYNFLRRFSRIAKHCLALRRAGQAQEGGFTNWVAKAEFEKQQREFLRELGSRPMADLTTQAARLPAMLAWTISVLCAQSQSDIDDYILATAVPVARKLAEAGLQPYLMADNASLAEERQQLARKMVERLAVIQPCKFRELVRGFDHQSKDIFMPTIDVLISEGIIQQDPKKFLTIGQVPLAKLQTRQLISDRLS